MAVYAANGRRRLTGIAPLALSFGGLGTSLADPNADRVTFWDDSEGEVGWLTVGDGLSLSGTTLRGTGARLIHEAHTGSSISGTTSESTLLLHSLTSGTMNVAGRVLRVTAFGSVTFTGSQSLTLRLYVNDGSDHEIGSGAAMSGSAGTQYWKVSSLLVTTSTGGSGTVCGIVDATSGLAGTLRTSRAGSASTSLDLTGANGIRITGQVSNSGASAAPLGFIIEQMN